MDSYIYVITALLPLVATMLLIQTNPYRALVIRGILGAVTALVYTLLGAADVAVTEALVGTLLAITLYAVAVRSSLVLRLGVLKDDIIAADAPTVAQELAQIHPFKQLMGELQTTFDKHYMRVELIPYLVQEELQQALLDKEVHAICTHSAIAHPDPAAPEPQQHQYQMTTRLQRLHEILQAELVSSNTCLAYLNPSTATEVHS